MGLFDILPKFGKKDKAKQPPPFQASKRAGAEPSINVPAMNATAVAPQRTYTVKSGDTLSKIARAELGDAKKYMVLFEANRAVLSDPDKIYPGQVLKIPESKQLHS